ncbi:MAG: hypothetical protein OEY61_04750 [Gammaproteobacteria bacterium]|nr:hypothetical protein [Gammaproteobacteria bacterium]
MNTINKYDGKTKHWLHLVLSFFTGGLWIVAWMVIHNTNEAFYIKTQKALREGNSAPSDTSWMIRVTIISFSVYLILFILSIWASIQSNSKTTSDIKPINAFTTIQDSDGITEKDLDNKALLKLEEWVKDSIVRKTQNSYSEKGYDPDKAISSLNSSSIYALIEGKKLAIINVTVNSLVRYATIMSVSDNSLLRVNCIRLSNHDIPLVNGVCGDEIYKTFGVKLLEL